MTLLGIFYSNGQMGLPKDDAKAKKLFLSAAVLGRDGNGVSAAIILGEWAEEGRAGPKSESSAKSSYLRAANQGSAKAQFRLGMLYLKTAQNPSNKMEAYIWIFVAAENGHDGPRS